MPSLELDARYETGKGLHPSTQSALLILEQLQSLGGLSRALDVGCGTGILALSIAAQWQIPVVASDIAAEAIAATQANAQHNGLSPLIEAVCANGCDHPAIAANAPYSLIVANLLAELHLDLLSDYAALLDEEGLLLCSGILLWKEEALQQALHRAGFTLCQRLVAGDWVSMLWQKEAAA